MANGWGGKREGAGRTERSERYAPAIVTAEDRCRDRLPQNLDNLEALADGRAVRIERKFQPAGVITRKCLARDKAGEVIRDAKGKMFTEEVLIFPDLPADQLVLIEEKQIQAEQDFRSAAYLADRILGKPVAAEDLTPGATGTPMPFDLSLLDDVDLDLFLRCLDKMARGAPPGGPPGGAPPAGSPQGPGPEAS